jgi:hypothetical protein
MANILGIIAPIIGGIIQSSAQKKAARKAEEVGRLNAQDLMAASEINADEIIRIAGLNGDAILETANLNAQSVHAIGLANAISQIDAGRDNVGLAEVETLEVLRRQNLKEVETVSNIRAATGASGVRLGVGSPLQALVAAVDAGNMERQYLAGYGLLRLRKIGKEAARRGALTWMNAAQRGKVMLITASIQEAIGKEEAAARAAGTLRDAELNAASLRRGGTLLAMNYRNQATASMVSGILGGIAAWNT